MSNPFETPPIPSEEEPFSFEDHRDAIFDWIATMRKYGAVADDPTLQKLLTEMHERVDKAQETDPGARKMFEEAEIELASYEADLDEEDFP